MNRKLYPWGRHKGNTRGKSAACNEKGFCIMNNKGLIKEIFVMTLADAILLEKGQKKLRKFTGGGNNCIVL